MTDMTFDVALKELKRMKNFYDPFKNFEETLQTVIAAEAMLETLNNNIDKAKRESSDLDKALVDKRAEVKEKNDKLDASHKRRVTEDEIEFQKEKGAQDEKLGSLKKRVGSMEARLATAETAHDKLMSGSREELAEVEKKLAEAKTRYDNFVGSVVQAGAAG